MDRHELVVTVGQNLNGLEPGQQVPGGVWTLADVLDRGRENITCPYFTVRRMVSPFHPGRIPKLMIQLPFVDIIIYSFHYLLDPKVAEQVSKEMSKDAIVVFDEAHNIGQ